MQWRASRQPAWGGRPHNNSSRRTCKWRAVASLVPQRDICVRCSSSGTATFCEAEKRGGPLRRVETDPGPLPTLDAVD